MVLTARSTSWLTSLSLPLFLRVKTLGFRQSLLARRHGYLFKMILHFCAHIHFESLS